MTVLYVAPRIPICDVKTGIMNPIWYRFFSDQFATLGNGGVSNSEAFEVSPTFDLGGISTMMTLDDVTPEPAPPYFAPDDVLPVIAGLQSQIAALTAALDDLRKGTVSI